ncbi:MAG: hypothetical protein O3C27_11255 [Actinomycetota bacterium]|nr:hypothetical protein [Actinomycetota bacterium]
MALQSDKLRLLGRISEIRFEEELRGYSKQQVDRVLENLAPLADEIEALQNRLAEAETRAASAEAQLIESGGREVDLVPAAPLALPATPADFDETLRNTLLLAQRTADETVRRANEDAARITGSANTEAEQTLAASRAEAAQLDVEIQARRAELLADVDTQRRELLSEMTATAEARRLAIESELTQTEGAERAEMLGQIKDLQGIRAMLVEDVELLEQHLDGRRSAVRVLLAEIAAVVDEPERLRADGPTLATIPPVPGGSDGTTGVRPSLPLLDALVAEGTEARASGTTTSQPFASADLAEPGVEDFILDPSPDPFLAAPVFADPDLETDDDSPGSASAGFGFEPTGSGQFDTGEMGTFKPAHGDASLVDFGEVVESDAGTGAFEEDPFAYGEGGAGFAGSGMTGSATTIGRPTWADAVPDAADLPVPPLGVPLSSTVATAASGSTPPPPAVQDPFLDQLRRATTEGIGADDDALDRFLEGDPEDDRRGGGWFGWRR